MAQRRLSPTAALPKAEVGEEAAVGAQYGAQSEGSTSAQQPQPPPSQVPRRRAGSVYDTPDAYQNIDDVNTEAPVQNIGSQPLRELSTREERHSSASDPPRKASLSRRRGSLAEARDYSVPDKWANLDELAAMSPVENYAESPIYRHQSLEETRSREQEWNKAEQRRRSSVARGEEPPEQGDEGVVAGADTPIAEGAGVKHVSKIATQLYTISYLIFFSFLGTMARIGLTALTTYPGTPVIPSTIWANFAGSLIMGFLAEDRMLFRYEWGTPTYDQQLAAQAREKRSDEENGSGSDHRLAIDTAAAKKAHLATKKTIPLYIGLATGFCGSFTSFSTFIRDVFLALSNDMATPGASDLPAHRNGGYSFMALLAVIIMTTSLSLCGLFIGAHLAIAAERFTPSLPTRMTRKFLDRLGVFLAWGCWVGAVLLAIFPPHDVWRGRAVFSLVFAPLGCLARFYLALYLNGISASFPVGTFAANVGGTVVLGMSWDLAHVPVGGVVGCQVLQGVEDGFCGCLTTISTWVAELSSLRRRNAYVYGSVSVLVSLALLIAIMGGLRWSHGFDALLCSP